MANNAVVGVLRALLTADTAQYERAFQKATVVTGKFGQETKELTEQAKRMAAAFSGDKMLARANNLVAAVQKVGGAARLTEAEQRRVNAQLTESIAKYQALGRTAPAAMIATEKATRQVDVATSKWGTALGGARTTLAAFGVTLSAGAVIAFGRELLTTADNLVRVADRTGLTTTEVQKLEFVARQSGNSIDDFTGAIGQLQNRLVSGDKSAVAAVKALGINFQELRKATPFDQLSQIAKAIGEIPDPATRAAIAIDLFGRQGAAILPTLIADFDRLANAAPKMSDATVRALDTAGDALDQFQMQLKVWAAEAFNFAGRLFDQFVIVIRRAAALLSDSMASLAEFFASSPIIGGPFKVLAQKLRADAQLLRDAADATAAAMQRQETEVRKNTGALVDYDALLNRAASSTDKVKKASDELLPLLHEHFRWWKGMPPAIEDTAASLEAFTGIFAFSFDEATASAKALREQMEAIARMGLGPFDFSATTDNQASQEAADIAQEQADAQQQEIEKIREQWRQLMQDIARWTTQSISDAFSEALVGLRSFKDAFISIWQSIRRAVANIIASMLDNFIKGFIEPAIRKLGELAGSVVFGNGGGGGGGAGNGALNFASSALNFAGGLLNRGGGGQGPGNGLMRFGSSALPFFTGGAGSGLPGTAPGLGSLSFLQNPAFWTNPITIGVGAGAALLTWGILKKGWFRGGEEGVQVNPKRDQFLAQFGPGGTGPNSGFGRLAAQLAKWNQSGLFRALTMADSMKEWRAAQDAIVGEFFRHGTRLKSFAMGGFIPPGVTQLAVLHGGSRGEVVAPVASMGATPTILHRTVNNYIQGVLDRNSVRDVMREHVWPEFNREMSLNQFGGASSVRRTGRL